MKSSRGGTDKPEWRSGEEEEAGDSKTWRETPQCKGHDDGHARELMSPLSYTPCSHLSLAN